LAIKRRYWRQDSKSVPRDSIEPHWAEARVVWNSSAEGEDIVEWNSEG
jgi:hypothetical protein